ncbi:hypothetical protein Nepgr_033757 [Nepenthes gracilis]|uniref:Uncharacterized protein n=1 Tax=Nepenthes gracilis TaxID=150966 RepID=A0AAD3TMY0_NEPGR|nr:hypothetical protein Nepgr_033757 [Nepenthes gracilis]
MLPYGFLCTSGTFFEDVVALQAHRLVFHVPGFPWVLLFDLFGSAPASKLIRFLDCRSGDLANQSHVLMLNVLPNAGMSEPRWLTGVCCCWARVHRKKVADQQVDLALM